MMDQIVMLEYKLQNRFVLSSILVDELFFVSDKSVEVWMQILTLQHIYIYLSFLLLKLSSAKILWSQNKHNGISVINNEDSIKRINEVIIGMHWFLMWVNLYPFYCVKRGQPALLDVGVSHWHIWIGDGCFALIRPEVLQRVILE